jgi:hypothetical protein
MRSHEDFCYKSWSHFNKKHDSRQLIGCTKKKNCGCQSVRDKRKKNLIQKNHLEHWPLTWVFRRSDEETGLVCFGEPNKFLRRRKQRVVRDNVIATNPFYGESEWNSSPSHIRSEIEYIIFKQISKYFLKNFTTKRQRNFLFRTFFERAKSFKHSTNQSVSLNYVSKKKQSSNFDWVRRGRTD